MHKNINNLFSYRKIGWFLFVLFILILSALSYVYILQIQTNKPDDKIISWIDHQDIKSVSILSTRKIKNVK